MVLTKAEHDKLITELYDSLEIEDGLENHLMRKLINKYTNHEIKVGDIYLNKLGYPCVITALLESPYSLPVRDHTGQQYSKDGRYHALETSQYDLDLTKKYKLVEVKDDE